MKKKKKTLMLSRETLRTLGAGRDELTRVVARGDVALGPPEPQPPTGPPSSCYEDPHC